MLEKNLQKYFNFSQFRPGQKEIVEAIMNGHDTVALMPTGGGKSLCYQLPSIIADKLSVVISPLIALMKDQVDALNARGIPAVFINSSLTFEEIQENIVKIKTGQIKILYVAPERFGNAQFQKLFSELDIFLFSVDEAHCVSQWGHDFRPDYLEIRKYIRNLKKRPIVAAFTATATTEVKDDIIERLELKNPKVFIRGFDRPNLKFLVQCDLKTKERYEEILRIIKSLSGAGIVYSLTRKETEVIAKYLKENGIKAIAYHAGMEAKKREKVQEDFMENKFQVIVATVAFGMGVDKADIRFVIHSGMPGSLEGYYQEAGRAGRDGEKSYCVLLHAKKDVNTHKFFIRMSKGEMQDQGKDQTEMWKILNIKYDRLEKMVEYATSKKCRRTMILEYFNDPELLSHPSNCRGCDVCLNWKATKGQEKFEKVKGEKSKGFISGTIKETVKLYEQKYSVEKIAKIRGLGIRTIYGHLIDWYASGGKLKVEDFLSPSEEEKIARVVSQIGSTEKLSPIKAKLPASIGYEKIKLAIVRMKK
ncbi:MAG: RecQ family ATP-dependent DNA helicase [Candidatus Moraniibacteriota bacterium]